MALITGPEKIGYLPMQNPGYRWDGLPLDLRHVLYGVRVVHRQLAVGQFGDFVVEPGSGGDIIGASYWPTAGEDRRPTGAWSWGPWPAVLENRATEDPLLAELGIRVVGRDARPVDRDRALPLRTAWKGDVRFRRLKVALPPGRPALPSGTVGLVADSTEETGQELLFFPADGRLVAVNHAGDPAMASTVWDLTREDEIDPERGARLHSMMRVVRTRKACGPVKFRPELNALAWQLGTAGRDALEGYGLVVDAAAKEAEQPEAEETPAGPKQVGRGEESGFVQYRVGKELGEKTEDTFPPEKPPERTVETFPAEIVIGSAGVRAGGPLDVGPPGDAHELGRTADGEPVNSCHLSVGALWRGQGGDAPLAFERALYVPPGEGSFPWAVHLRLNKDAKHPWVCGPRPGLWQWELFLPIFCPPFRPPLDGPPEDPEYKIPPEKRVPGEVTKDPAGKDRAAEDAEARVRERMGLEPGGTHLEFALPSILGKPQFFIGADSTDDVRYRATLNQEQAARYVADAPVTAHLEAWGAERGKGSWAYTNRPGGRRARYRSGTANGGFVVLPPELGLEDIYAGRTPGNQALSRTYLTLGHPNVRLALAEPESDGTVSSGFYLERDTSGANPQLNLIAVDTSGAQTQANPVAIDPYLQINSRIGFFGTTPQARPADYTVTNHTADRSWDESTVSLRELARAVGTILADLQTFGLLGGTVT